MINLKSIKNKALFYLITSYLYISHPHLSLANEESLNATQTKEGTKTLDFKFNKNSDLKNIQDISPQNFMAGVIVLALNISLITFMFIFLLGGYRWLTSSGDEKKLAVAKNQITHGLIGLVIILCSWLILKLIGYLFGIDNIFEWTIPSFSN